MRIKLYREDLSDDKLILLKKMIEKNKVNKFKIFFKIVIENIQQHEFTRVKELR
jgi:hypothetical protein